GAKYSYRVVCFNGPSASPYSNSINVVATPTAPADPAGLAAKAVSSNQINLTWQDKAINETSYVVERSTDNRTWRVIASLPANSSSDSDTGLNASTTYSYRIRAFDGPTLASNYTKAVNATTLAP